MNNIRIKVKGPEWDSTLEALRLQEGSVAHSLLNNRVYSSGEIYRSDGTLRTPMKRSLMLAIELASRGYKISIEPEGDGKTFMMKV